MARYIRDNSTTPADHQNQQGCDMTGPTRQTRRRIAYWIMWLITAMVVWMMLPGDINEREQALAMVIVPSLVAGIIAFITGETYSDYSTRKHGDKDA